MLTSGIKRAKLFFPLVQAFTPGLSAMIDSRAVDGAFAGFILTVTLTDDVLKDEQAR
jgi:hypothetical protein